MYVPLQETAAGRAAHMCLHSRRTRLRLATRLARLQQLMYLLLLICLIWLVTSCRRSWRVAWSRLHGHGHGYDRKGRSAGTTGGLLYKQSYVALLLEWLTGLPAPCNTPGGRHAALCAQTRLFPLNPNPLTPKKPSLGAQREGDLYENLKNVNNTPLETS